MVTSSQAATQCSIEELHSKLKKDHEDTAKQAAKKIRLSAELNFRKKGNKKQYRFNEVVQEHLQ